MDAGAAKKDAARRLTGEARSIVDLPAQPKAGGIAFDPPRLDFGLLPADPA